MMSSAMPASFKRLTNVYRANVSPSTTFSDKSQPHGKTFSSVAIKDTSGEPKVISVVLIIVSSRRERKSKCKKHICSQVEKIMSPSVSKVLQLDEEMANNEPPAACQSCSGQEPRSTPVEVEDMATPALEKLIRKASIAQQMLEDVMKQLQKQRSSSITPSQRSTRTKGGKKHKGRHHHHHHRHSQTSSSSSSSDGNASDCELIAVELDKRLDEEFQPRRRHIREDRKRDRCCSRGRTRSRSRGHSRGRSHGRSRSRSYTDSRRRSCLPMALPVTL